MTDLDLWIFEISNTTSVGYFQLKQHSKLYWTFSSEETSVGYLQLKQQTK